MTQKQYYDTQHGVKELHPLQPSDRVWVQGENKPAATVKAQQPYQPQSYIAKGSGSVLRRNKSALLPYFQQPPSTEKNLPDDDIGSPKVEPAMSEPDFSLKSPKGTVVRTRSKINSE